MLDFLPPMIDGTLREHYILLFGSAGAFAMAVGLVSAWTGAYFGARRASRRAQEQLVRDARDAAMLAEQRFAQLSQAVDAIATEVERISEGQRYTTRLLAERGPAAHAPLAVPRREAGTTTPH